MRRRRRIEVKGALVITAALIFLGLVAFSAQAQTPLSIEDIGTTIGLTTADLKSIVINVIRWLLGILALVAVSFIMYGGYLWLTAAGNSDRIEKAKRVIINAVIGLVIVLIAWAIVFFVARVILGSSSGGPPGTTPPPCIPGDPRCSTAAVGFEIRSITTDCGSPPDYQSDVFRCSSVSINFNHPVKPETVAAAVRDKKLIIEQCNTIDPDGTCADPQEAAVANQEYRADAPLSDKPYWVTRENPEPSNAVIFYHRNELFAARTSYRLTITKDISDTDNRAISACRQNLVTPVPGCDDIGASYQWTMLVGDQVDTEGPRITSTYPTSEYNARCVGAPKVCSSGRQAGQSCTIDNDCKSAGAAPDQNVPREPIITVNFDQAFDGLQINQNDLIDPRNNSITLIPFTPDTGTADFEDGTEGPPVDPRDFIVVADGTSLVIQMKPGKKLDEFTWYKVVVKDIYDLCNNPQEPNPFQWVFETNNVVAGIADHYPRNGANNACDDTQIFIRYTLSMYDAVSHSCEVGIDPSNYGFVTQAALSPGPAPGTGPKAFNVNPSQDPLIQCLPGRPCDYNNLCKWYEFTPPPPYPPSSRLRVNTQYRVAVDNRYQISDTQTLRFGEPFVPQSSSLGEWHFDVKPAGECVNPPVITWIDPSHGPDGQCITVNGYNFDKVSGYNPGDNLSYDGADLNRKGLPDEQVLSWADTQIAAEVPAGPAGSKPFVVKADFPAPFGNLSSPPFDWTKDSGNPSEGPCLASINPNQGLNLTPVDFLGKRFNETSATKEVYFDTFRTDSPRTWKNELIQTSVPADPPLSPSAIPKKVYVKNNKGESNRLDFTVTPPPVVPPGTPVVRKQWPNCGTSCTGVDVGAEFTLDMDTASFSGAIVIKKCSDTTCSSFVGADIIPPTVLYDGPPTQAAHFPPASAFDPDTYYRVILKNTIKSTPAEGGGTLGNLNYNNGSGSNDSYSWVFKTQSGSGGCKLDRVNITPASATMCTADSPGDYVATAYTEPNSCSAVGQIMTPSDLTWTWSSDITYATVTPKAQSWTAAVAAVRETVPVPGSTPIRATGTNSGISKSSSSPLTVDCTTCDETTDCSLGGTCPGSACVNGRCTPVLKSISRSQGATGTWLGINGCYFGGYARGKCVGGADDGDACDTNRDCDSQNCQDGSAVIYTSDKRGVWPDAAMCGLPSTHWGDSDILSEVPDKTSAALSATSGPIQVQRWDGKRSNASSSFVVDPAVNVPGICKIQPSAGSEGTPNINIYGQNFGSVQGSGKVTFYKEKDVLTYGPLPWSEKQVEVTAPNGIANNTDPAYELDGQQWQSKEVALKQGEWSNVVNFDVRPPGCQACTEDLICGAGNGCGYNGCCAQAPTVVDRSPSAGRVGICLNAVATATFDRTMDAASINTASVHLQEYVTKSGVSGWREVPIAVSYNPSSKIVSITPRDLLRRNTNHRVSLSEGSRIRSADGVALPLTDWTFLTEDRTDPCRLKRVEVDPPTWTFATDATHPFTAHAFSETDVEIFPTPSYNWDWNWRDIPDPTLAEYQGVRAGVSSVTVGLPVGHGKGRTLVIAAADNVPLPTGGKTTILGNASILITACTELWTFKDNATNCTLNPGGCQDFHFDSSYCADNGLPKLNLEDPGPPERYRYTITGATGGNTEPKQLKEFLFKELNQTTKEGIGIRIYDNSAGLSALEWYKKYVPRPGTPSSMTVDGYEALRDGRTIYVAMTDFDGSRYNPKIVLISYSQEASPVLLNIFGQMVENWFFNNDTNSVGICNRLNDINKVCIQRDLKRLAAVTDITQYLRDAKIKNGTYPQLGSGSFLSQLSFSVWPSWQQTLGNEVGKNLPVDPINTVADCPAGQATDGTCWNEPKKKFFCLPDVPEASQPQPDPQSHILSYRYKADGSVELYANLEYHGTGSWANYPLGDPASPAPGQTICASPSHCQCFNYSLPIP
ncbi:MAG: Ig-like domain-containing protein [Candidatus Kerfeldbacteria bacterium]|nr:Ig-like domain-containing protein [Candidatus Kerfeldbacteria bacterium]